MKITGAIFDMDGTLLNSMDYWAIVPCDYLKSLGIEPDENASMLYLEKGMKAFFDHYNELYNFKDSYDEALDFMYKRMDIYYEKYVCLKDGALDLLKELKKRNVKICLATATDRYAVENIFNKLGISEYFSAIFTSKEVGVGKWSPLIYQKALDFLGTDKETTYVFEDAFYAIKTAKGDNFKVVGIYDKNVLQTPSEIASYCDYYLSEDSKYKLFEEM
jgi:HAD superfamily hydrolase (TIGR01509 family)